MSDGPGPILSRQEARRRFLLYFGLKLAGLGALAAGLFLSRGGLSAAGVVLVVLGAASIAVRPRHLGLTTKPEK